MNLDLLYMIPLAFENDILPKFIHFAFALATATLLGRYLSKRLSMDYALLGVLFFLTIPVVIRLSSTVYVDLGLIFFLFASLLSLFRWVESGFRTRYLLFSAILCGLALGTKYNGLIGLFLLALFVAFVYTRYHARHKFGSIKAVGWCSLFIIISLTIFSPWMIRNLAWTGNPVYPLYDGIFNEASKDDIFSREKARPEMSHIQVRRLIYGESWLEIAALPVRVFFQGKDDTPKYFDGKINPFLLLLPIFALLGIRREVRQIKSEKIMMLFFSVLFLLYACAQASIRIRYFAPVLPPLVVLSMLGLHNIQTRIMSRGIRIPGFWKKISVFLIVAVMLGLNGSYMAERFMKDQPLAYLSGKVGRAEYIQAYRPEYASFQYANRYLPKGSKILGLYIGNRGYYSNVPIEFDFTILQKLAAEGASAEIMARSLRENGFTHLLVNYSLFNYWANKYNVSEKRVIEEFFNTQTIRLFSKDGHGLLKIA
jgi:4-amino-4-deoxy-L-arabinose transferase-like glycosyltransferase